MDYEIIRSKRKTLGIEIKGRRVIVRSPFCVADAQIDRFVNEHEDWIQKHFAKAAEKEKRAAALGFLTEKELRTLADKASDVIPERVEYYAKIIGVSYGRITIRKQRTKWGSCSGKGNLSFNCLLMLTTPEVIDCIVVHELCHRKEMNHSEHFYEEVRKAYPEYDKWHKWLKVNGGVIMSRMK